MRIKNVWLKYQQETGLALETILKHRVPETGEANYDEETDNYIQTVTEDDQQDCMEYIEWLEDLFEKKER